MKKRQFIEGGIQKIEGIMVSKNSPAWDKFRFISGAKSKDQTRFFMQGIHIEHAGNKTILVSTDGRRLHIATMDTLDIDEGDYEVKENTRDFMILYPMNDDISYPNWKRIVQQQKAKKHAKISFNNTNKGAYSQSLFSLFKATDRVFNSEYIEALAAVVSARYDFTWDVYFDNKKDGSESQTVFVNKDLIAVIMPMQHEEVAVEDTVQIPSFVEYKAIEYKPETAEPTETEKKPKKAKKAA